MIVLDTNVISEPLKPKGNPVVQAWLDRQAAETLYLTATSLSELLVGVAVLPDSKRKTGLDAALSELLTNLFGPRILAFDQRAAMAYASLVGRARSAGAPGGCNIDWWIQQQTLGTCGRQSDHRCRDLCARRCLCSVVHRPG